MDVRQCEHIYEKLAEYLDLGFSSAAMYRALRTDFPEADMPPCLQAINEFLRKGTTWLAFHERFGRPRTEELWAKNWERVCRPNKPRPQPELDTAFRAI